MKGHLSSYTEFLGFFVSVLFFYSGYLDMLVSFPGFRLGKHFGKVFRINLIMNPGERIPGRGNDHYLNEGNLKMGTFYQVLKGWDQEFSLDGIKVIPSKGSPGEPLSTVLLDHDYDPDQLPIIVKDQTDGKIVLERI